jgi:hypothetical protein
MGLGLEVQTYSSVCDSSLGRIGSLLLGSVAERCHQVSEAVILVEIGYILIIAFSIAAVLCVIFGTVYVLKHERMEGVYLLTCSPAN